MNIVYNIGTYLLGIPCFATHQIYESRVYNPDERGTGLDRCQPNVPIMRNIDKLMREIFFDGDTD